MSDAFQDGKDGPPLIPSTYWTILERIALLLKWHNDITHSLCTERYPTIGSVIEEFNIIMDHLERIKNDKGSNDPKLASLYRHLEPVKVALNVERCIVFQ